MLARNTAGRAAHDSRPSRESLSKRLGKVARQIKARDDHRCVYCTATADEAGCALQLDHLTPKSEGGADVATNLVVACRRCNSARQAMPLTVWATYAATKLGLVISARAIRAQAAKVLPC